VHTYTSVGVFIVTLTVTDTEVSETDMLVRSRYITVTASTLDKTWQTITTTTAPPVDGEYAMAYDSGRDDSGDALDDFWTFDLTTSSWNEITAAGDTVRADTWHYQVGDGWTEGDVSGTTPATAYPRAVYDSGVQAVILFHNQETSAYR